MSDHHSKKHKKQAQMAKIRHIQDIQHNADAHELGRILEEEREKEIREASLASGRAAERQSAGQTTVWSAKVQMIKNKNNGRLRAAESKWNRFSGTESGGGRGL